MSKYIDIEEAMDLGTLLDWYISSVSQEDTPVWTEEHIQELLNDYYVIPKELKITEIPENAVVLTSNQKISLEHEWYRLGYEQARKETAEKFAEMLKIHLKQCFKDLYRADYKEGMVALNLNTVFENIDEIRKEIPEGKV